MRAFDGLFLTKRLGVSTWPYYLAAVAIFILLPVITFRTGPFVALWQLILPDSGTPPPLPPAYKVLLHPFVVLANPGFGFGFLLGLGTMHRWREVLRPFVILLGTAIMAGLAGFILSVAAGRGFSLLLLAVAFTALTGAPYSIAGALLGLLLSRALKTRTLRGVLSAGLILGFSAPASHADCPGCTKSYGVTIQLKSGAKKKGYLAWNNFFFEGLIPAYGLQQHAAAHALLKDWYTLEERGAFARWVEVVNLISREHLPLLDTRQELDLTLFRDLIQVEHPRRMYVIEEGAITNLSVPEIATLTPNPQLTLFVDTTGSPVLSRQEIALLRKRPRFWVEQGDPPEVTDWAVYGRSIRLTDVLEHLMSVHGDRHGSISVNGVRITGGGYYAPAESERPASDLGPMKSESDAFLRKLSSYEKQPWKAMPTDSSGRIPGIVKIEYGGD